MSKITVAGFYASASTADLRTILALAACEGVDDAELAKRGAGSLRHSISRKREYREAADALKIALRVSVRRLESARSENAKLLAKIAALESQLAPVEDVSQAAALLAAIAAKRGGK